ncbi:MAG: hypothetical protein EBY18_03320 [Alphaproteobacteria bacterium]|nr:hypothetical protein [Alphaproteobacteria bacterium]
MRSIGAVLSILWIIGIGIATWLLVTEDPTSPSWLVRFVVIRPRQDPNLVGLDGFGLVSIGLALWRWLFGAGPRDKIR